MKSEKVKKLIAKHFGNIAIAVIGAKYLSKQELAELKSLGVDVTNQYSLIDIIYKHNFLNADGKDMPKTLQNAIKQQVLKNPKASEVALNSLNESMKIFIKKMEIDALARIETILRDTNDINNLFSVQSSKKTNSELIQDLKKTAPTSFKDWQRIVLTEVSNAIGLGSVDKIVAENNNNIDDVYVFRLPVNDSVTCRWCKKFYNSKNNMPKIYKLSTLLANGSNYGKSKEAWKPVVGATHPNTRTSPIIEIKPGYIVQPGGVLTFVGAEKSKAWLKENIN